MRKRELDYKSFFSTIGQDLIPILPLTLQFLIGLEDLQSSLVPVIYIFEQIDLGSLRVLRVRNQSASYRLS